MRILKTRYLYLFLILLFYQVMATEAWREHDYDVIHYKIKVGFDHDKGMVSGNTTIMLTPLKDYFNSFELDAHKFTVKSVKMDSESIDHIVKDDKITIILPRYFSRRESLQVSIEYQAYPVSGIYFFAPDKKMPDRPKQIWTQGEGEDNHHWFPCYDYPNDKATFEVIAEVDRGQIAICNGKLISRNEKGKKVIYHYKMDKPMSSYLIDLVVGEYDKYEQSWNGIPLEYYVYQHHSGEDALRSFGRTPVMMQFFSDYTGFDYPYSKYAQILITEFMFAGMENTTATTITDRTMHTERAALDFSSDNLVAHELAHQWWGDMVTMREWSDIWLNEGFATYFEHLFNEFYNGTDRFAYDFYKIQKGVIDLELENPQYLTGKAPWRIAYTKGASVVHMMRNLLGENRFRAGISEFLTQYAYKNAETHDLRRAMEDASGVNLFEFFDQWVFNGGIPEFDVTKKYDSELSELRVHVRQVQDSINNRPAFRVKLFIGIDDGQEYSEHQIEMTERDQLFTFAVKSDPKMVIFDAGQILLKKVTFLKSPDDWIYQASHAHRIEDRLHAIEMLPELETESNHGKIISALLGLAGRDKFFGIRANALEALTGLKYLAAELNNSYADTMRSLMKTEHKSAVRINILHALAKYRIPADEAVFNQYFKSDLSYGVRTSALQALLEVFPAKAEKYLKEAMKMDSWDEQIRETALDSLLILADKEAFAIAKSFTKYGNNQKLRAAAVKVMGKLAEKKYDPAFKALLDVVKEGGEDNRYRPVSLAIAIAGEIAPERVRPLLEEIVKTSRNKYVIASAERALAKLDEFNTRAQE
ncbi:MAG: M1 family aminopeptidase [Calditrichaceae bacterium]